MSTLNSLGKTTTSNFILQNSIAVDVDNEFETIGGLASNYKHPNSIYSCQSEAWFDIANGVLDCVDHFLYGEK